MENRMRSVLLVAALGVLSLLLAACASEEAEAPPAETPADTPAPTEAPAAVACPAGQDAGALGLVAEIRLDGGQVEFAAGQPVPMTFVYTNCGSQPVRLEFRDGQRYEFTVHTAAGQEVWRWSADRVFTQALGEEAVEPGATVAYTEVWEQVDGNGQQVPAATYHIQGASAACPPSPVPEGPCPVPAGLLIVIRPA